MGSKPAAPVAPDPVATANAQGAANTQAARDTAAINRYDQSTPFGSSTWTQNGDKWSNSVQLDPKVQGMLDKYMLSSGDQLPTLNAQTLGWAGQGSDYRDAERARTDGAQLDGAIAQSSGVASNAGDLAGSQVDRLKKLYGTEFNYDKAPAMPEANEAARKAIEDAYYQRTTARLDPRFQAEDADTRSRLANQGLTEGSEAYNRELELLGRTKNDAYSSATNDAILNSTGEMEKLFGMGLAARQQGVGEANTLRQMPTLEAQAAMGLYGDASGIRNNNMTTQAQLYDSASTRAARDSQTDWNARGNMLNEQDAFKKDSVNNRNQLLNELMALQTGTQVQAPGGSGVDVQAAPIAQSIYNNYQGQVDQYKSALDARTGMLGMIGQMGASAAAAY